METPSNLLSLEGKIVDALKTIYDPELPVNIYEMGLIYEIKKDDENNVTIIMTLTSPNCPVAESLPIEVKEKVSAVEGVKSCFIDLVFEPEWTYDMMSDEAKLEMGLL